MDSKKTLAGYLVPKLSDIIFISIFMGVIFLGPRTLNVDGDLGRHIAIGNFILASRTIPATDVFSHTMTGEALTPHEWLSQVLFSLAHNIAGLNGIVFFEAIIIAITFILVYKDTQKLSESYLTAAGLTFWAAAASSLHWIARPHILTFFFLALWTPLIRNANNNPRKAYLAAPLLMVFWANSHGAFIAGFAVLACFILGWIFEFLFCDEKPSAKNLQNLLVVGLLSFTATLLNPVGLNLWATSLGYIQNNYLVSHTQEYLSPDFHTPGFLPFLVLLAFMVFILSRSRRTLPPAFGFLLAGWTTLALYSARNIPLFAIISVPIMGLYLNISHAPVPFITRTEKRVNSVEKQLHGFLWPGVVVLLIGLLLVRGNILEPLRRGNQFDPAVFPVEAVNWLKENPQSGNMFNYFTWGGYLLYRLWPNQLVFIDGQTDFYGEELTRDYAQVISADSGWEKIIEKYKVKWIILPPNNALAKELRNDPTWDNLYNDSMAIIYQKK